MLKFEGIKRGRRLERRNTGNSINRSGPDREEEKINKNIYKSNK